MAKRGLLMMLEGPFDEKEEPFDKKRGLLMKTRGLLMEKSGLLMMQKAPRGRGPFDDVLCGKGPLRDTILELLAGKKGVWAEAGSFGDSKCRKSDMSHVPSRARTDDFGTTRWHALPTELTGYHKTNQARIITTCPFFRCLIPGCLVKCRPFLVSPPPGELVVELSVAPH